MRIQISAERQENAKQQRLAKQMANRQLVVPSATPKQQAQQVNIHSVSENNDTKDTLLHFCPSNDQAQSVVCSTIAVGFNLSSFLT